MLPEGRPRIHGYVQCMLTGVLAYLVVAAIVLAAYLMTQGSQFFVGGTQSMPRFITFFAAPLFLSAFLPFLGLHLFATLMRMKVTPLSGALAGAAIGALNAYAICGREACFAASGQLPLLGWYLTAIIALSALFHTTNAARRAHG